MALGRFIAASGVSNLADGVAVVAWAWLASLLTRDALLIALVPFTLRIPWFLFALPAGIVTDRVDRRRLILVADAVRLAAFALVAGAILLALPLDPAPDRGLAAPGLFAAILSAAALVGIAEVFRDNAAQTMLPSLVTDKARLERANARLWTVEIIGNALIGPALGAVLIAIALPLPFALNALAYGLAFWLVLTLPGRFRAAAEGPRDWKRELREGVGFLNGQPMLRLLALITGSWNLVFQIALVALVLHVQENLGLGAPAWGLVLAGGAVGGILGALAAERVIARLGPGRTAQVVLALSALCMLAIPFAPDAWSLALVLGVFEFQGLIWNVVSVSYRQRMIPDRLYGRVNSVYRLLAWGGIPLGAALSGLIVRWAEVGLDRRVALEVPFFVAALGSTAIAVAGWRGLGAGFTERS